MGEFVEIELLSSRFNTYTRPLYLKKKGKMRMKINLISKIIKGEEYPINKKGCEEMEISSINDIKALSFDKKVRYIGFGPNNLYRLSLKSFKEIKKYLQRTGKVI